MRNPALLAIVLLACSPSESPRQDSPRAASPAPADSMVLLLPDSGEVWFTASMLDTAATGETCNTRTLEIRRGTIRTPVPLLYTMGTPAVVNDSTVSAALVRDCVSHDTYLVSTKTGQPRRAE